MKIFQAVFGVGLFALATIVLYHELHGVHYHQVVQAMAAISDWRIVAAVSLTVVSYLLLTCYDVLALRYIRHPLPYHKVSLASFISYAFSNTIGLSLLTSGTIRYRMYSAWGLNLGEIGKVLGFTVVTLWLGIFTVGGGVFSVEPQTLYLLGTAAPAVPLFIGLFFLLIAVAYLLFPMLCRVPINIWRWQLELPEPGLAILQVILGACDWLCVGTIFVLLLPEQSELPFGMLLAVYLTAQLIALISHVPGGLGVFESLVLIMLKDLPTDELFGSLLVFRSIYFLLPLIVAGVLAGVYELREYRHNLVIMAQGMERWSFVLVPHLLSALVLLAGAVLLLSGATPEVAGRLRWLEHILPLPVIEISHFLGSLVGACLLLLARGLQKRLDGAYLLSVVLLAAGAGLSLTKGVDYEESVLLLVLLVSLLPCKHFFYRRASLLQVSFSWGWSGMIILVVLSAIGLGLFAGRHHGYSMDLWWQFALEADIPRSLRAVVGATVFLLLFGLSRLLRTAPPEVKLPDAETLARARKIIAESPDSQANLALLGDKSLLFNETGTAMIMYAVSGRSWVAMGDPIGPETEMQEMAWLFWDLCERHNGWPIFYEVGTQRLHIYLEMGLNLLKLGEKARVFLPDFGLEGRKRSGLRYTHRRMAKDGFVFAVEPAEQIPMVIDDMKRVSDLWLGEKNTREKGFSLGFFEPSYLCANPVAIVRKEGKIVAFTNLWPGSDKGEFSIDMMRYTPDAPRSVMEYLFICLILWGKENGYQWLNLGMAPLSGLEARTGAPLWNRLGSLVFQHGEHFYKFQGLREYKEKFDPQWEGRYLASPGGLALPAILTHIAGLIGGGVKGVFRK